MLLINAEIKVLLLYLVQSPSTRKQPVAPGTRNDRVLLYRAVVIALATDAEILNSQRSSGALRLNAQLIPCSRCLKILYSNTRFVFYG